MITKIEKNENLKISRIKLGENGKNQKKIDKINFNELTRSYIINKVK